MKFAGVNVMLLSADTVKLAIEHWMNATRFTNELRILDLRVRRNGTVVVKFAPQATAIMVPKGALTAEDIRT